MKSVVAALAAVCWLAVVPGGAAAAPAAPSSPPADPGERAAYEFTLAKMLLAEGAFDEALAAFGEAEKLAPADPYVRVEHAELLGRLGLASRQGRTRTDYMAQAASQAAKARSLAPDNPDILRGLGEVYLELSQQDPAAMAQAIEAFEQLRKRTPSDLQIMVTLGRIYLDRGLPEKAADVFRELVSYVPNNSTATGLLVESLLKARRPEQAEAVLKEELADDPESIEERLTLADIQSHRGDHRAELDTLLAAPEAVRGDPQLRRQLASALYLTGDLDSALATADALLKSQPDNQYLVLLKGLILTAQGRNAEALALLGKLRQTQPQDVELAATVARILRREGRRDEAAALLADLATDLERAGKEKEARDARLELAQLYFLAEEWQKVGEALAPLLSATDPAVRSEALLLQAEALVSLKRYDQALDLLSPASASPAVAAKHAEVLFRSGRERQGRRQLEKLARADDPQAILAAAQSYQRLELYKDSIPILQRLLASHPKLTTAGFLLGAAYERNGQRDEAVATFRGVIQNDPDFHAALNYLGYMWAERGENLEEALKMVRRAVALVPDNGAYVDSLGWTHFQLHQYDRARSYLERATRLEPEDSTVHEHLGDVYAALGETGKAREMYERALKLGDKKPDQLRRKLDGLAEPSARP
ncbi:MAG TPA: tetratricopeptide repeat protein [Thermoanaerobaculia bacterium]